MYQTILSDASVCKLLLRLDEDLIAEYERAQIAERSRRGKRCRAQQGLVNVLSGAPFGYRHVKKSDHVREPDAANPHVRFDERRGGDGPMEGLGERVGESSLAQSAPTFLQYRASRRLSNY